MIGVNSIGPSRNYLGELPVTAIKPVAPMQQKITEAGPLLGSPVYDVLPQIVTTEEIGIPAAGKSQMGGSGSGQQQQRRNFSVMLAELMNKKGIDRSLQF